MFDSKSLAKEEFVDGVCLFFCVFEGLCGAVCEIFFCVGRIEMTLFCFICFWRDLEVEV